MLHILASRFPTPYLAGLALATVMVFAVCQARADTFTDNFDMDHDYSTGDVSGTIWDGVLNLDHLCQGDANISNPAQLTWSAVPNSGWENDLNNAPTLFRMVSGDFDVSVQVTAMTTVRWSDGGPIIRVPNDGGPENYVSLRYFGALGFNSTRNTVNSVTQNRDVYGGIQPYLRITRTGSEFDFFTKAADQDDWILKDVVIRDDMGQVDTLQVGLWFGTFFTGDVGQVQFAGFNLVTP